MDVASRIEAIKQACEDYWQNPEALAQAKAIWNPECQVNKAGIFSPCPREIVAKCGAAWAEVGVCRVREGVFVHCSGMTYGMGGYGYSPSIWSAEPHASADGARRAGIREVIGRIDHAERMGLSHSAKAELSTLKAKLREQVSQPTLFD